VLALRWTARIWSLASVGLVVAFIVGEGLSPSGPAEWLGFLFFPFGICAGMLLAWRREGLGGTITIASLAAFYVVRLATEGVFPEGWAWLAFAAPGYLFMLAWFLSRRRSVVASAPHRQSDVRRPADPPAAIAKRGWRYHHLGIPYAEPRAGERHLPDLGVYVCGFETSPYGIEWMRFEPHCRVPDIVRQVPHLAFAVGDLDEALKGEQILIAPNAPSESVRVAFILHDGAPVELLQFGGSNG